MRPVVRTHPVLLVLALFLSAGPPAPAGDSRPPGEAGKGAREVKPTREWSGSVEDVSLQKQAPAHGVITDEKTFATLWRAWQLGDQAPAVDFDKELVFVATTSGSRLRLTPRLTEGGDLKVLALATRDFRPGFRYRLVVLPRAGVKTVNGQPLPKE
jgi:hypothetical protein